MTIQVAPLSPAELVEALHSLMDKAASDKGLRLTSEIDRQLREVLNGDSARLQQILVNVVNNAIKFTDQGSIRVRLYRLNKNRWSLEVSDSGRGIPPEELPHIFDTFHQVEMAATRIHRGFGLGLSIVKHIANLMDGDVTVHSKMNMGKYFHCYAALGNTTKYRLKGETNERTGIHHRR